MKQSYSSGFLTKAFNGTLGNEAVLFNGKAIGDDIGVVEGYIATYDLDRGYDRFTRGAFSESINDHKSRNRHVRLLKNHKNSEMIGVFDVNTIKEDSKGLFGRGLIDLDVQSGREMHSLSKKGMISDFSIGFSIDKERSNNQGERIIEKATIWEGSLVTEPMNPEAVVTGVKSDTDYSNMTQRDLEDLLRFYGLSRKCAKIVSSNFIEKKQVLPQSTHDVLDLLESKIKELNS